MAIERGECEVNPGSSQALAYSATRIESGECEVNPRSIPYLTCVLELNTGNVKSARVQFDQGNGGEVRMGLNAGNVKSTRVQFAHHWWQSDSAHATETGECEVNPGSV